jgi:hypothetical protein
VRVSADAAAERELLAGGRMRHVQRALLAGELEQIGGRCYDFVTGKNLAILNYNIK